MNYTVYIDMLFFVNFIMDLLVLLLLKKVLKYTATYLRIGTAAALGALWVCFIVAFPLLPVMIEDIITYIVISSLMVKTAFRLKGIKEIGKGVLGLYITTASLGGLCYAVYGHTKIGYYVEIAVRGDIREAMPVYIFLFMIAGTYFFARFLWNRVLEERKQKAYLYDVTLYYLQRQTLVKALSDTGNGLFDPISKKPVSIITYEAGKELCKTITNVSYIPFQSVGTKQGMLVGVVIDKMVICQGEKRITVDNPMIAIYRHKLSADQRYDMLLHPALSGDDSGI